MIPVPEQLMMSGRLWTLLFVMRPWKSRQSFLRLVQASSTGSVQQRRAFTDCRRTEFNSRGPYHLWDKVFVPCWPPLLLTGFSGGQSGAWADRDDIFGNAARFPGERTTTGSRSRL